MNKFKIAFLLCTSSFATEDLDRFNNQCREVLRSMLETSSHLEEAVVPSDKYKTKKFLLAMSDLSEYLEKSEEKLILAREKYFSCNSKMQELKDNMQELKKEEKEWGLIWYVISKFLLQKDLNLKISSLETKREDIGEVWGCLRGNIDVLSSLNEKQWATNGERMNAVARLSQVRYPLLHGIDISTDAYRLQVEHFKATNRAGELLPIITKDGDENFFQLALHIIDWKDLVLPVTLFDVSDLEESDI
mgnify:CR=1 FL=1